MKTEHDLSMIQASDLAHVHGGGASRLMNAAKGFVGGMSCLGKFVADGTPGTNAYDTYLACQRQAHQF